jgi:hypothetical protein
MENEIAAFKDAGDQQTTKDMLKYLEEKQGKTVFS